MRPNRRGAALAARVLGVVGSAAMHSLGAWLGVLIWPILLFLAWMGGMPADDTYTFRWDNPFFRGRTSPEDEGIHDVAVIVTPLRKPRELPEMERPRELRPWDSRRLPFDESLGPPSPLDSSYFTRADSGWMRAKGESLDFVSDKPFRGKGTYDVAGAESGGGGRYGSKVILKDAVQLGLLWLARHQAEDGSWSEEALAGRCGRPLPDGREVSGPLCGGGEGGSTAHATALALLAFAGAGYGAESPDAWDGIAYRDVIGRAERRLSGIPEDPGGRALVLLARARLLPFPRVGRPDEIPGSLVDLRAAVEADAEPPEDSDAAAWRALAFSSASRAGARRSRQEASWELLRRRCATLAPIEGASWPGGRLESSYLRLLASFDDRDFDPEAPRALVEYHPVLRRGQVRDPGACREGSWEPAGGEGRLLSTILHVLALESLPGYGARLGHPTRD